MAKLGKNIPIILVTILRIPILICQYRYQLAIKRYIGLPLLVMGIKAKSAQLELG